MTQEEPVSYTHLLLGRFQPGTDRQTERTDRPPVGREPGAPFRVVGLGFVYAARRFSLAADRADKSGLPRYIIQHTAPAVNLFFFLPAASERVSGRTAISGEIKASVDHFGPQAAADAEIRCRFPLLYVM